MAQVQEIDVERAHADVEEKMAKLRSGEHDYDVKAAAEQSEELVRRQLKKDGFSEAELAELDKHIGQSSFSEIAQRARAEEEDVALLIAALSAKCDALGEDYKNLGTLSDEDKKKVDDAAAVMATCEADVKTAQAVRFFRGSRIATAETALEVAKTEHARIEEEAKAAARARLRKANFEQSFSAYVTQVHEARDILQRRLVEVIDVRMKATEVKLEDTYTQRKKASEELERITADIETIESELRSAESDLDQYDQTTEPVEYAQADQSVNTLRAKLLENTEQRNVALGTFQIMERFVVIHESERTALRKQRGAQRVWIETLTKTAEERLVSFRTALAVLQVGAEQEHASMLMETGERLDLDNLQRVAATGHAAEQVVLDMFQRHPEQMMKVIEIQQAAAKAYRRIREDYGELAEHMKVHYGIDITESSFFDSSNK